jgi:methyl-accepting chemotaxis protein
VVFRLLWGIVLKLDDLAADEGFVLPRKGLGSRRKHVRHFHHAREEDHFMKLFSKMKIAPKLGLGFGVVLMLVVVLGGFSLLQMSKLNTDALDLGTNWMLSVTYIGQTRFDASKVRRWELNYFFAADKAAAQQKIDETLAEVAEDEKKYEPTIASEGERAIYQGFRSAWEKHLAVKDRYLELLRQGKEKEAVALSMSEGLTTFAAADQFLADDVKLNVKGGAAAITLAADTYSSSRYWVIGLMVAAIVVGLVIAFGMARSLSGAATRMLTIIQAIADKNLIVKDLEISSQDEVGLAGVALNGMKNNLHEMIQSIRGTAEQVAAASEELSATGQQITANSEETTAQAKVVSEVGHQVNTNLQTLASGAEEMNSTIGEIAKNATEAARVSGEAVEAADSANQTVLKLGDSSVEIEKVIEVITSIAQQTNLLALNATIEAARAGEAGKGFAVVANEVKELAKQTAKATEEIKQKIAIIRENTGGAVEAIGGIKGVIDKVSQISTTIATAVEEQSATTSEMARNVTEAARGASTISDNIKGVAEAAQSTSTNVGESQTATEHLSKMANELRDLVGQFKVGAENVGQQGGTPSTKVARRAAGAH